MNKSQRRTSRPAPSLLRSYHRRGWRRGVEMLEFTMIVPFLFLFICFSIDMGNVVFLEGTLHDAVFVSARTGAQFGAAGTNTSGASYNAFNQAVSGLPGGTGNIASYTVVSGSTCTTNSPNNYVQINATYRMQLITPGLYQVLSIFGGPFVLKATGVARCEVVRF
jgi:Flp pilus assembly protein TadG